MGLAVFLEFGAPTLPTGFDIALESLRREMEAAGELSRGPRNNGRRAVHSAQ
jgi:hypothetical protein